MNIKLKYKYNPRIGIWIPGKPQSFQQLQMNRKTGAVFRTKAYKEHVDKIRTAAKEAVAEVSTTEIFDSEDALALSVSFEFPYDQSWYQYEDGEQVLKHGAPYWYNKKIDIDNMLKSLKDGMKDIVYPDDSQIVEYKEIVKRYTELKPGTRVTVERV